MILILFVTLFLLAGLSLGVGIAAMLPAWLKEAPDEAA